MSTQTQTIPAQKSAPPKSPILNAVMPFIIGGTSGVIATSVIQPLDMIKVQIQLRSEKIGKGNSVSPFTIVKEMLGNGKGFGQFYKGLDSALIRQVTYTTTRLGVYKTLFNKEQEKTGNVSMKMKSIFGLTAGFCGSIVGNPADLILIRFQADSTLPVAERRNYRNFFDALSRIIKEEGTLTLWRGSSPTIARAMVINFGMLAPFDQVKEMINKYKGTKDTLQTRMFAAAVAGFFCSFLCLPFDNAKTKMQKMTKGPDGKFPYKGIVDALAKSARNEGFTKLWVGFPTFYVRIAPHVMISLVVQDILTDMWNKRKAK